MSESDDHKNSDLGDVILVDGELEVLTALPEDEQSEESHRSPVSTALVPVEGIPGKTSVGDPLKDYIRKISRHPLLTQEREKELTLALHETGDIEVAKQLVMANLRLVVKIAMEYRHSNKNVMDLIQEGNIGLMKAVSKFDPHKGTRLGYYASWWIKSYILKFIIDNFRLIKIGTTQDQKKLFYNLVREKQRLEAQGIKPTPKMISENLNVSEKAVVEMDHRLGPQGGERSLDLPIESKDGGSSSSLYELLPSEEQSLEDSLDHQMNLGILKDHLKDFLETLRPRDREIFQKRLLSDLPTTLQGIADEYGVSRERIRQIEARLLEKLKVYMSEFLR
jgi:RNA polymerase sigma-32 factor